MSEERKTKTDAAAPASAALERIDRKDAFLQALHTFLTAHQGTEWAVAAVDIQHFKLYNELYGTEKGDVLLETMANCLLGYSKQTGYPVGYFGNDDFFLCLPDEKAEQTAVLATLQACMAAGRQDVTFFVVMGVCPVQANPGADAATLCNYAQIAGVTTDSGYLHRFEPTMLNELKEQQLLLGELERALDNHEFCFFLQPKCNSITHALGDDGQVQPVRHIHHRLHDLHALAAVLLIHVDELHVQLDGIDVGILEHIQRGIPAAEVVHHHREALAVQSLNGVFHHLGVLGHHAQRAQGTAAAAG